MDELGANSLACRFGVSGAATATFVYDGDGNRVKGTIGGVTTTYIGSHFEWTGSTSTMKKFYYAGATRVAMRTGSNTLNYLLGDHLGSTSITANSSGVRSAEIRYYPWGTERYNYGTTPTTYHFTGQIVESGIGLYFYGARWYDSSLGRWIQPDTDVPESQGVQGLDRYAYVNNSPVNYTDPSGHMMTECGQDNHECNKTAGEEYSDYVYNVLHNEEERRENTEKVETSGQILGAIGSVAVEPVDWALTAGECLGGDCSPLALLGLLPLIPGSAIDDIVDAVRKLDGQKVLTDDILDLAAKFLGKDYIDMGNGRFLSADGLRQVRMGIDDITAKIPHVNFDILKPVENMPGRYDIVEKFHILIAEMFR